MSVFHFKQFDVINEKSAMKVNTDGVLLGALMTVKDEDRNMLDIGTGTGTIAMMAAQRHPSAKVTGIDIDAPSAEEAAKNFAASKWSSRLEALNVPLQSFGPAEPLDLIFSNPPYFDNSLTNPDERKSDARHTESLSYREILAFASSHLADGGRVAVVLPAEEEARLLREARSRSLFLFHLVRVRTTEKKQPRRIVAEFSSVRIDDPSIEVLTIQEAGSYTEEYLTLLKDFYLFC